MKRIGPSKIKETITTSTSTTSTPKKSKMPSRTGKKEPETATATTTTKVVNFEEVEGVEETFYYNRDLLQEFFNE